MILVDTNILVALADRRDTFHEVCQVWLQAQFLDAVGDGPPRRFHVIGLVDDDIRRMAALVRQYADRRLGGTDASIIAVAERLGVTTVATVNRRDFDNVRPTHVRTLNIVP